MLYNLPNNAKAIDSLAQHQPSGDKKQAFAKTHGNNLMMAKNAGEYK